MNKKAVNSASAITVSMVVLVTIIIAVPNTMNHNNYVFAVNKMSNTSSTASKSPEEQQRSILNLTSPKTPVVIPLLKGLYDGKDVLYITTEVSDKAMRATLGNFSGSPVNYAPNLTKSQAIGQLWVFKNGVKGAGPLGFQATVFDSIPGDTNYTPLWKVNIVEWNKDSVSKAAVIGSDDDISNAASKNLITMTPTNVVVNCPIVMWGGNKDNTIPPGHI